MRFVPGWIGLRLRLSSARRLLAQRRFEELEALVAEGLAAHPGDPRLLSLHALCAHNAGALDAAAQRWQVARAAGAAEPLASACLASDLWELGDVEGALALIGEALERYPTDVVTITVAARLANARNQPREAVALWRRAIALRRPHPEWLQGLAQSLVVVGEFAQAERVLRSARRQFPDHMGLRAVEGAILVAREQLPAAIAFWSEYRRRYPDDPTGWEQLGTAVQAAALQGAADTTTSGPAPPALADIAVVDDEATRRLVLRFESLGDSCEMGLVQRRYGAEPLGLLRWNDVGLDNLVTALEHRLDGMGAPENTEILVAANGEFYVRDRRWSLAMHTFQYAGHLDREEVFRKMCRRIAYLRDKLLEDLTASEKVFVYRSALADEAAIRRLHAALCAYGPATLLAAVPMAAAASLAAGAMPGEVRWLAPRLAVGILGRAGSDARGNWDIAFEDWTHIFAATLEGRGDSVSR